MPGGGIAVFIQISCRSSNIHVSFSNAESLALKVLDGHFCVSMLALYQPLSENIPFFLDEVKSQLSSFRPMDNQCIIVDLNIDVTKTTKSVNCDYLTV